MKIKNFINRLIAFFIIFFTLSLIFIIFKSEFVHRGQLRNYYIVYYIIIIILLSIFSFVLFLKNIYKTYLLIITYSLILGLYAFEGIISYKLYADNKNRNYEREKKYFKENKKKFDNRSQVQIFNDLIIFDKDITLSLLPKVYFSNSSKLFPLSNVSKAKTIFCNENGYYSIYQSDRYGFNNPNTEWDAKKINFLVLGDSFLQGACVNRPDDIASHLRNISKKSVINLGYKGNGPLMQLAGLREYLTKDTENVVWFYFENDIWDLKRELDNKFLKNYLDDITFNQNLINKQSKIDIHIRKELNINIKKEIKKKHKYSQEILHLIKFFKLENIRKLFTTPVIGPEFRKILKIAIQQTKKNNTDFYFVYMPSYTSIKNNTYDKNFKDIKIILNGFGIPLIDIKKELFDKKKEPLNLFPFGLGGHYNESGYKNIAETIYFFISK